MNTLHNQNLLFCPGPVNLDHSVWKSMIKNIGHREAEFSVLLKDLNSKLLKVFEVKNPRLFHPMVITGSGTAANETVLSTFHDKKVLVITNGEFGERLFAISKLHNPKTQSVAFTWGERFDLERVETVVKKSKVDVLVMVHHETSTGMLNPLEQVGGIAKKYNVELFVDTVSSSPVEKLDLENWNVTYCTASSGKAISALPGLGIILARTSALEKLKTKSTKIMYLDLYKLYLFSKKQLQTPNTPAVHLFFSLDAALTNILTIGLPAWRDKIRKRASQMRAAFSPLGLEPLLQGEDMSSVLTTVRLPKGVTFKHLKTVLRKRKIVIYGGKGPLKNKFFQVGHIGNLSEKHIKYFLSALRDAVSVRKTKRITISKKQVKKYSLLPFSPFVQNYQ